MQHVKIIWADKRIVTSGQEYYTAAMRIGKKGKGRIVHTESYFPSVESSIQRAAKGFKAFAQRNNYIIDGGAT